MNSGLLLLFNKAVSMNCHSIKRRELANAIQECKFWRVLLTKYNQMKNDPHICERMGKKPEKKNPGLHWGLNP